MDWLYRVIRKSLYTWWLQYRKLQVMFKVSPASLKTYIDTLNCVLEDSVQYSTVHIPNVFCSEYRNFACSCTVIVRCTETFWSSCIMKGGKKVDRACFVGSLFCGLPVLWAPCFVGSPFSPEFSPVHCYLRSRLKDTCRYNRGSTWDQLWLWTLKAVTVVLCSI